MDTHCVTQPKLHQQSSSKVVDFKLAREEDKRKERYLTAKYGSHQMSLIRKRLKVEMWMFEQLQHICKSADEDSEADDVEVEIDLDQVLDIEDDIQRKQFLMVKFKLLDILLNMCFQDLLAKSASSKEVIDVSA